MIRAATEDLELGWIYDSENGFNIKTVAGAVHDPDWQKVRLSMKGVTTQRKLEILKDWREINMAYSGAEYIRGVLDERAKIQIDNYLGALRRGGQLDMQNMIQR